MRFSPLFFACLIAQAQAQTTPMTAADAFAAGKSSGDQAAVKSAFDSVTSAKGTEIIPGYSASTPPQSSYWSPSALIGPVLSGGVAKIAECDGTASSDPKIKNHCEAVQAIARQPSLRPPNLITASDPLIVKGDAIANNPEAIAGAITGIYSACTTKTVSLGKEKQTETCEDYATTGSATCEVGYEVKVDADHLFKCLDSVKVTSNASCIVGRTVLVDKDTNYQCVNSVRALQTPSCNRNVIVTVTPGGWPLPLTQTISGQFIACYQSYCGLLSVSAKVTSVTVTNNPSAGNATVNVNGYASPQNYNLYVTAYSPTSAVLGSNSCINLTSSRTCSLTFPATVDGQYSFVATVNDTVYVWGGYGYVPYSESSSRTLYATFQQQQFTPTYSTAIDNQCTALEARSL